MIFIGIALLLAAGLALVAAVILDPSAALTTLGGSPGVTGSVRISVSSFAIRSISRWPTARNSSGLMSSGALRR